MTQRFVDEIPVPGADVCELLAAAPMRRWLAEAHDRLLSIAIAAAYDALYADSDGVRISAIEVRTRAEVLELLLHLSSQSPTPTREPDA